MKIEQATKEKCPICNRKLQFKLQIRFQNKSIMRSINKKILSQRLIDFRSGYSYPIYGLFEELSLEASCLGKDHTYQISSHIDTIYNYAIPLYDLELHPEMQTSIFNISNKKNITLSNDFLAEQTVCHYDYYKKLKLPFPFPLSKETPDKIEGLLLLQ